MEQHDDSPHPMNGAQSLMGTLVESGVEVCFANPGTSEMHFVAALDSEPRMRAVLGLFEGVVTGMADGYGRLAEKPAATLLHLGPGLSNGSANLHNARRAGSPIVNVVGDHATSHARYDAPLASDIIGLARPVSHWVHATVSSRDVAADGARAVRAARQHPGQVATLILPADTAWEPGGPIADPLPVAPPAAVTESAVATAAGALRSGRRTALLIRGAGLRGQGLVDAGRIRAATGTRLLCDTFAPRLERGAGKVAIERLPYFAEQLIEALDGVDTLVLVGAKPPVSFFGYPGVRSWCLRDDTEILTLAHDHEDTVAALAALADALAAPEAPDGIAPLELADRPTGQLDQFAIGRSVARLLPEGAIIADEAATSGLGPQLALATAAPHEHLSLTGGSIGQALPLATGAAVACPDRRVVCLSGDGGAMYTVQALWTMARERLDVTTVIFSNRSYAILRIELDRVGAEGGPTALSMFDLADPAIDWVRLAEGMGVEAIAVDTAEAFDDAFAVSLGRSGPMLIEARI